MMLMVLIDIFTPFLACLIPPARKYKISYCRHSSSSLLLLFFSWEKLTRVIDQEKLKSPIIRWDNLLLMIPLNIYGTVNRNLEPLETITIFSRRGEARCIGCISGDENTLERMGKSGTMAIIQAGHHFYFCPCWSPCATPYQSTRDIRNQDFVFLCVHPSSSM